MGEVKKKGRGLVLPAFPEHVTLISKKHRQGLNSAVLCTLHGYVEYTYRFADANYL